MSQSVFTQGSVSLTTTPEYLPVSGFNTLSLHLSQSPRLHPFQISQTNCNNPSNVSHIWPACGTKQLFKFRSRKTWKQTHSKGSLFRFKLSSKQFPLPTQFRSFPLTYSTTCSTQTLPQLQLKPTSVVTWCIWEIKTNVPKQANKVHSDHAYSQSVVNQQSQHQVPLCLQCHDGSYLSLSALQYLHCQANHHASGFNLKVTSQCKHPSSPTVPAHYRTSGVQLLTSYHKNVWQLNQGHWQSKFDPPGSHANVSQMWQLNQGHRPSRLSCQRFSNMATKPRSPTLQALMPTFLKYGN